MKKTLTYIYILFLFSSCAPTQNASFATGTHAYGFFGGFWHGLIAPFDLIGMLIWDDVTMYAPNNNGIGYAIGFMIGIYCLFRICMDSDIIFFRK